MKTKINKKNNTTGEAIEKLKFTEKLACVINNGTGTFHVQVVSLFMLFFYIDIMKINPGFVAVLFLVVRVLDAVLTPVLGLIMDKVTTPWGKYKPWILIIGALLGIFGWFSFTNFNLGASGNMIYATITYTFYSIALSMSGVPSNAITPAVTKKIEDRLSMGQISYMTIMIGATLGTALIQPLYKVLGGGNDAKGFSLVMGIAAIFSIILAIWQKFIIKERYITTPQKGEKGPSVIKMLGVVFSNKTALIVYTFVFAINLVNGLRNGVQIFYMKYYFHNDMLVTISALVAMVPMLLGVMVSSKLTKRIGIKTNLIVSAIVQVVAMAAVLILPPSALGVTAYLILIGIIALASGISNPAQQTMLPSAIDYTEWKTNLNMNGFMSSFQGFLQTLATAVSGAIAAGALAFIGYNSEATTQSSGTILGLRVVMSIMPAVAMLLTLTVVKYDLTEEKQAQITKELAERRKAAEESI